MIVELSLTTTTTTATTTTTTTTTSVTKHLNSARITYHVDEDQHFRCLRSCLQVQPNDSDDSDDNDDNDVNNSCDNDSDTLGK